MKNVTIIGGGIAGLSCGIALRQRGVPVTVIESGEYPRHKVCGEFVSGRGAEFLSSLGIDIARLGADVQAISFHNDSTNSAPLSLPEPGIGISRYRFDFTLVETLKKLGGHVKSSTRFQSDRWEEGYVCATGRRRQTKRKWKWYGLKAHVSDVELASDLELHLTGNGYVGLCRVDGGKINVCGLFRRSGDSAGRSPNFLEHFSSAPSLRERLVHAKWDEHSFAAVSALPIGFEHSSRRGLATFHVGDEAKQFLLGDALSMIPPFTGNGMSFALESASLAVDPLASYSGGELSWSEASTFFQTATRKRFRRRLSVANAAQNLLMLSFCKRLFMRPEIIGIWRHVFSRTR